MYQTERSESRTANSAEKTADRTMGNGPVAKHLLIAAVLLCAGLHKSEAGFPLVVPTQGEPWPAPQQADMYDTYFTIDPATLSFNVTHETCVDLKDAVTRYRDMLRKLAGWRRWRVSAASQTRRRRTGSDPGLLTSVEVYLGTECKKGAIPQPDMDEQYLIKINSPDSSGRAQVIAQSIWGMYRGLETFTHLIYFSDDKQEFRIRNGIIRDYPRFPHRGLLLDTGRHFLPVPAIKETLDLMAQNKLNVFHWHVVDDQSFPFVSLRFPALSKEGAYASHLVYTEKDVSEVIEYARQRGIRAIPEFDSPGHTRSWGAGQPGLLTACYNQSSGQPDGTYGPVDPSRPENYHFIKQLLQEVTDRFPDRYIHLGGDEVSFGFSCWLSNPDIQKWMKPLNITTPEGVEDVYIRSLLKLVDALPKHPEYVVWQEVVDNNITVGSETIVQVWKDGWEAEMRRVTSLSHRAILSSCWYLDHLELRWSDLYACDPQSFNGSASQDRLVLGGEACMWGEMVDNTNLTPRVWPRAAAVAERLWSPRSYNSTEAARSRLEEHRCRLLRRGYRVQPANGPGFC